MMETMIQNKGNEDHDKDASQVHQTNRVGCQCDQENAILESECRLHAIEDAKKHQKERKNVCACPEGDRPITVLRTS